MKTELLECKNCKDVTPQEMDYKTRQYTCLICGKTERIYKSIARMLQTKFWHKKKK